MKKLFEFEKARLWRMNWDSSQVNDEDYYGGDWEETIFLEADGHPYVLAFTAQDDDGYRSHLYTNFKRKRLEFVMMPGRELVGEFEDVIVFEHDSTMDEPVENEDDDDYFDYNDYTEYKIYSKGDLIASASEDRSDDYYPHGSVSVLNHAEFIQHWNSAEKEVSYTFRKHPPKCPDATTAIVVTGEPRLGKTSTLGNYGRNQWWVDTDNFNSAKDALDTMYRQYRDYSFIIGKFRNTKVVTEEGVFSFKDAVVRILQDRGLNVFELEFLKRQGAEYDDYAIIIENETNENLSEFFNPYSETPVVKHVSEKNGDLPEDHYIHARFFLRERDIK